MNQIRSQKVAPPRWIEAIVQWLMPRSAAARLEDLKDYNLPALQLAWQAADALVSASAIVASQLLLWLSAPSLLMEPALLVRGTVIGILSVSLLRAYFHLKTPQYDPDRQRAIRQFRSTWRIMAMWIIACITLMLSSI